MTAAAKRVKFQQEDRATFRETSARRFGDAAAEKHVMAARKVHIFWVCGMCGTSMHLTPLLSCSACNHDLQTIETLDERGGILRHQLWPPLPLPLAAEEEEAAGSSEPETEPNPWDLLTAQQRLADVLGYLREHHFYCLFCGCQVGLVSALSQCIWSHLVQDARLCNRRACLFSTLLVWLQFNDAAEMAEACPGPAEDDH